MRGSSGAILWIALAFVSGVAVIRPADAQQQYFNGSQTTPNGAINGGGGTWDSATTNWTDATGTASSVYSSGGPAITVFGSSGSLTPATGGIVSVSSGGVVVSKTIQFRPTGDNSIYAIQGGPLFTNSGTTTTSVIFWYMTSAAGDGSRTSMKVRIMSISAGRPA